MMGPVSSIWGPIDVEAQLERLIRLPRGAANHVDRNQHFDPKYFDLSINPASNLTFSSTNVPF